MSNAPPSPLLLAGPTAVGKSAVALSLAERIGGEIISVDSMQVYRGMDLGTAKPSREERERVPHHLIDVEEITKPFDAAKFVRLAHEAVLLVQSRGKIPILCGGTGLYIKAFLEGLGEAPPADPAVRAQLEQIPMTALLQELAERDPVTYERIDRANPRRLVRAIEVIRITGKPFSSQRAQWTASDQATPETAFAISRSPGDLHRRIEARVEEMFRLGLVQETESLLQQGLSQNPTASCALGYRQVAEHLRGGRPIPQTIELVKIRTRQFAKRQMTWFRRQLGLNWISLGPAETIDETVTKILRQVEKIPKR